MRLPELGSMGKRKKPKAFRAVKAVREIKLTVTWEDPEDEKNTQTITLTTHLVNIP